MKDRHRERLLGRPVKPIEVSTNKIISSIINEMASTAFQGRALGEAVEAWKKMLKEERIVVWLGLAGAMVPAGMRKIIAYFIRKRMIDVLVTTGANLYHDLFEALGGKHCQKRSNLEDRTLRKKRINRIYDVLVDENRFYRLDHWIEKKFAEELEDGYIYSSREISYLLGKYLSMMKKNVDSILISAYHAGVPIFCPALADSSLGFSLMFTNRRRGRNIIVNGLKDIDESVKVTENPSPTGVIYIGGGVPKNFIQQTAVIASYQTKHNRSHKYAVQITMDMPFWGGLSGSTLDEGKSWGKTSRSAKEITCYVDSSIALPFIAHALVDADIQRKSIPNFIWSSSALKIDFKELD